MHHAYNIHTHPHAHTVFIYIWRIDPRAVISSSRRAFQSFALGMNRYVIALCEYKSIFDCRQPTMRRTHAYLPAAGVAMAKHPHNIYV